MAFSPTEDLAQPSAVQPLVSANPATQEPDEHDPLAGGSGEMQLAPQPVQDEVAPDLLSLPPLTGNAGPPNRTADQVAVLAQKADFALGDASPGLPTLTTAYQQNDDFWVRQHAQITEAMAERKQKMIVTQQILNKLQADGKTLGDAGVQAIMDMNMTTPISPDRILEKMYANKYVNALPSAEPADQAFPMKDAITEDSEQSYVNFDAAEWMLERQAQGDRLYQYAQDMYDKASTGKVVWDYTKTLFPFHSTTTLRNLSDKVPGSSFLTGENIQNTIEGLYMLPPDQFYSESKKIIDKLGENSVVDAVTFANYLKSYSSFLAGADNFFQAADAFFVGQLTKSGFNAARALSMRLSGAAAANAGSKASVRDFLAAAGNVEGAAAEGVASDMSKAAGDFTRATADALKDDPKLLSGPGKTANESTTKTAPGIGDPQNYFRNVGSLSNERARRIEDTLKDQKDLLDEIHSNLSVVPTIDNGAALQRAFDKAAEWNLKTYPKLHDAVAEIIPTRHAADAFGNVDFIDHYFGRTDGTWFETEKSARFFATRQYELPKGAYEIEPFKGQFAIKIRKTVDELDPEIRKLRVFADKNFTPEDAINAGLAWVRGAEYAVAPNERTARHVATYGESQVHAILREAVKPIVRLNNNEAKGLSDVLRRNQTELAPRLQPDGSTKMEQGRWYNDIGELQQGWLQVNKRRATDKEITAYFAARNIYESDAQMRNTTVWFDKSRRGVEQKAFSWLEQGWDDKRVRQTSPYFEGKSVDALPWESKEPFTVGYRRADGKFQFALSSQMYKGQKEEIQGLIAKGHTIVQPTNPSQEIVGKLFQSKGEPVNYILSDQFRTKPLNAQQVIPHNGPHTGFPNDGVFVKQDITTRTGKGRLLYRGDKVVTYHRTPQQAKDFVAALNKANEMLKARTPKKVINQHLMENTPFKSVGHYQQFLIAHGLKADRAFHVVNPGQRVNDIANLSEKYGEHVVDLLNSPHNPMAGAQNKWSKIHDAAPFQLQEWGTQSNPAYKFVPVQQLDMSDLLERTLQEIANSRYYRPYLVRAAENWSQQFGHLLRNPEAARTNPMGAVQFPDWVPNEKVFDLAQLSAAKTSRRAILTLIGQLDTPTSKIFRVGQNAILDSVYSRLGASKAEALEPYLWTPKSDPLRMTRGLAFGLHIGMFNPRQLFLQTISAGHALAVSGSPTRAIQAVGLSHLFAGHTLGHFNPGYVNRLADIAANTIGITREQYLQGYRAWRASGMHNVGGEVGRLDTIIDEKIMNRQLAQAGKEVMGANNYFFNKGEKAQRSIGFSLAYLEWLEQNAGRKFNGDAVNAVIRRANVLAINQTRASSNPSFNRGLPGMLTQFTSFQGRLTEQLLGFGSTQTLTGAEKARAMLWYSAMYGPVIGVAGATVGALLPVYSYIRKYAVNNMDMNDPVTKFMLEGGIGMLLEGVTGRRYNAAESLGPAGNTTFSDLFGGDMWSLGGPGLQTIHEMLKAFYPVEARIWEIFKPPSPTEEYIPIDSTVILDAMRIIGTVDQFAQAYWAFKTGHLVTRNGNFVTTLDEKGAVMRALFGLKPIEDGDARLLNENSNDVRDAKRKIEGVAQTYYNRFLGAAADGNVKDMAYYSRLTRALIASTYQSPTEFKEAYDRMKKNAEVNGTYQRALNSAINAAPAGAERERVLRRYQDFLQEKYKARDNE